MTPVLASRDDFSSTIVNGLTSGSFWHRKISFDRGGELARLSVHHDIVHLRFGPIAYQFYIKWISQDP